MSMLATTQRPPAASAWAATTTLGWRAMLKIKHVPFQLFDVTAFPRLLKAEAAAKQLKAFADAAPERQPDAE